jgi:cytochrome P450
MSKNVQKSKGYAAMLPAPNALNTLMTVDKARHRKRRKIVNQAFSDRALAAFEPTLSQHINVFLAQLLASADKPLPVDVSERSRALALDVISAFSFGQSLDLQTAATNAFVSDAVEAASLVCGMYNQWPLLGALGAGRLFRVGAQTREQYGRHMGRLVAQRAAAEKDSRSDLFAFLLDARDPESGERLLPHELWSESRLFMIAGRHPPPFSLLN